ncbi:hypothetical protein glysoja_039792 [Glycine soja]|uniref:DUF7731 domain-containing protein n=1 Tax=Glycine soja TaxID=3848 RepID=A0A0B2R7Y5_GLYSO|nr:hypothetical protein glysoja_039792 [Glycine soja]
MSGKSSFPVCFSLGTFFLLLLNHVSAENVSASDISDFCNNGCKSHTLDVLSCIQDVKRDFYFGTKQNVSFVKDAIINACAASQRYGN